MLRLIQGGGGYDKGATPLTETDLTRVFSMLALVQQRQLDMFTRAENGRLVFDHQAWVSESARTLPLLASAYAILMDRAENEGLEFALDDRHRVHLTRSAADGWSVSVSERP